MLHLFWRIFAVTNDRLAENWVLANPEWKKDVIPEVIDGKNIADFIDPDIMDKLEALEREEEKLEAEGFYDNDEAIVSCTILGHMRHADLSASSTLRMSGKLPRPRSTSGRSSSRRAQRRR